MLYKCFDIKMQTFIYNLQLLLLYQRKVMNKMTKLNNNQHDLTQSEFFDHMKKRGYSDLDIRLAKKQVGNNNSKIKIARASINKIMGWSNV